MDLIRYTGTGSFGCAYHAMMELDAHAIGSVDRVLQSQMIRLFDLTADYLYSTYSPTETRYRVGSRPALEAIVKDCASDVCDEEKLRAIAKFTSRLGERAEHDPHKMQLGGTEEEIIERGSDWCTDVARVACVLCQVAGFPCRVVNIFDLDKAYSGHVIVEVYRADGWGAMDPTNGRVYFSEDGRPKSVWGMMNKGKFNAVGIVNYFIYESDRYDYTVSNLNAYYISILSMSDRGWPGGIRWLYGEDK